MPSAGSGHPSCTSTPGWRQPRRPWTQELWDVQNLEASRSSKFARCRTATVGVLCAIYEAAWHADTACMVRTITPELQGIHDCRKMTHWNRRRSSSNFTRAATIALWALLTTCSVLQTQGKEQIECKQAAARGGWNYEGVSAPTQVLLDLSEFLALLVIGRARGSFRALFGMLALSVWFALPLLSSTGPVTAIVMPCANRLDSS